MVRELGRILVTGADGFIGSHLVEKLIEQEHEVTALCIYNSNGHFGWLDRFADVKSEKLHLVLGDIRDAGRIRDLVAGHDTVFHLASLIAIPYSYQAPQSYIDTNISGTYHIAQACLEANVKRLIHTSTSEVYGTALTVPISERHPLQGQSPYSASKIGADMIVQSFYCSFDLPVVTLRPFNTYGPRQSQRAVIPTVISQILSGASEIKLGNIDPTRDFNFVIDTVNAFVSVASGDESLLGGVYNAGSGREVSIEQMVKMVAKVCDRDVSIASDQQRIRPAGSEVERLLCDASLLTEKTGWRPEYELEQGLEIMVEWMRKSNFNRNPFSYHR